MSDTYTGGDWWVMGVVSYVALTNAVLLIVTGIVINGEPGTALRRVAQLYWVLGAIIGIWGAMVAIHMASGPNMAIPWVLLTMQVAILAATANVLRRL